MAGFETIIRPMILPNIRPAAARPILPAEDPERGMFVIGGGSEGVLTQSNAYQVTIKTASGTEQKRQFDEVRIRPSENKGDSTRAARDDESEDDFWIDVEVVNKIWLKGGGKKFTRQYARVEESDNVEIRRTGITRGNRDA